MNLTTGQMIDTLKTGEIAECVSKGFYMGTKLRMTDHNEIVFTDTNDFFRLTTFAYSAKWEIKHEFNIKEDVHEKH